MVLDSILKVDLVLPRQRLKHQHYIVQWQKVTFLRSLGVFRILLLCVNVPPLSSF